MPTTPEVVSAFDDVGPRIGSVAYGDYTNDSAPVIRVSLGDSAAAGTTITVTSDRGLASAPVTLTAGQVAQGFVDVPVTGLPEGFSLLSAALRRADGSSLASIASFALGVATAPPATPIIAGVQDDVGSSTGALANGAHTDDATPTFHIVEAGLPPPPEGPPGHAPYGGPALLGGHLELYDGSRLVGDAQIGFGGAVTVTTDNLAPGDHTLTAVAVDRAGNVSSASLEFHVIVDGAGPLSSTMPTNGDDSLQASGAFSPVDGGPGNDTIVGAGSADVLRGGPGDDSIVGGAGFNAVNGNQGQDTIVGRSEVGDWLLGGQGADLIDARASKGLNILNGNQGDDTLQGGDGGGILRGGQGNDIVVGGSGADWISGDMGDNTLAGGGGADTFVAIPGHHTDRVLDFDQAEGDRVLILRGETFSASQVGADTVIKVGGQGEMILVGVTYSSLTDGWIAQA